MKDAGIVLSMLLMVIVSIIAVGRNHEIFSSAAWIMEVLVMVLCLSFCDNSSVFEKCVFQNRVILAIGRLSFQIMMFHPLVKKYVMVLSERIGLSTEGIYGLIEMLAAFLVTIILSMIWKEFEVISVELVRRGNDYDK